MKNQDTLLDQWDPGAMTHSILKQKHQWKPNSVQKGTATWSDSMASSKQVKPPSWVSTANQRPIWARASKNQPVEWTWGTYHECGARNSTPPPPNIRSNVKYCIDRETYGGYTTGSISITSYTRKDRQCDCEHTLTNLTFATPRASSFTNCNMSRFSMKMCWAGSPVEGERMVLRLPRYCGQILLSGLSEDPMMKGTICSSAGNMA